MSSEAEQVCERRGNPGSDSSPKMQPECPSAVASLQLPVMIETEEDQIVGVGRQEVESLEPGIGNEPPADVGVTINPLEKQTDNPGGATNPFLEIRKDGAEFSKCWE
jgi:hypothetical protein